MNDRKGNEGGRIQKRAVSITVSDKMKRRRERDIRIIRVIQASGYRVIRVSWIISVIVVIRVISDIVVIRVISAIADIRIMRVNYGG